MARAFPKLEDSEKCNTLLRYFTCNASEKTKVGERKRKDSEGETGAESENKKKRTEASEPQQNSRLRKFQSLWKTGRPWLNCSEDTKSMTCSYCIEYNTGGGREERSVLASKEGCTTFRLKTLRKHEESAAHKLAVKEILFGIKNQRNGQWNLVSFEWKNGKGINYLILH